MSETYKETSIQPNMALECVSFDKFQSLQAELTKECQARLAAENSKSELQASFNRLKALTHEAIKKRDEAVRESYALKELVTEFDDKKSNLQSKMELQHALSIDQLSLVSKIHNQLCNVVKVIDVKKLESQVSESLFVSQGTYTEENMRASLAGMECTYELAKIAVGKAKEFVEEKDHEIEVLDETVIRLVREKNQIGSLLKGVLSNDSLENVEKEEDGLFTLAGALGDVVKASQLKMIELQQTIDDLRAESSLIKQHMEAQSQELNHRIHRIEELEDNERLANENVEGLMADIASAEDEINRWKVAAEQEAAVGRAVEQEFMLKLSAVKMELEEAKKTILESEKNLKFKEETVSTAMAARDAAEESLKLSDLRASRLRNRVEELTHQLEEFEKNEEESRSSRIRNDRHRYVCWPWKWLSLDIVGLVHKPCTEEQETSNEMELSQPLV